MATMTLMSCVAIPNLSVNHFQDAKSLNYGESKYFISFEQALVFQFLGTKREANDFGQRLFGVMPNAQLGLGRGFEFGAKLLPITLTSDGVNLYLKYATRFSSIASFGLVFMGGYDEANGFNGPGIAVNSYYSYKNSIVSVLNLMAPITLSGEHVAFSIVPSISTYHARYHYIYTADYDRWEKYGDRDIDNNILADYLTPGVSALASVDLPLNSFFCVEFSTLQVDHAILGFYGVGFGFKGHLF